MVQNLLETIYGAVDKERVWRRTEKLWRLEQPMTARSRRAVAQYCADQLAADGATEVELYECPADGESEFYGWKAGPNWYAEEATLDLVGAGSRRRIADYKKLPRSLMTGSAGTPKGGVEAAVVMMDDGTKEKDYRGLDVSGKIILTRARAADVACLAAQRGAVGVVSDAHPSERALKHMPTMTLPEIGMERRPPEDAVFWTNMPGDITGLFGFALSPADGDALRAALRKNRRLRLRAKVNARSKKGTYPVTTGLVPGRSRRGDQIFVVAHLYEQGANDNASGCAVALEMASALNSLIKRGEIPQPKRSVRFLLTLEYPGTACYLHQHQKQVERTLAGLCLDSVGDDQAQTYVPFSINLNPSDRPHFSDPVFIWLTRQWLESRDKTYNWTTMPFHAATDNFIAQDKIGIPCPWIGGQNRLWHTTADVMERLEPRALVHCATISAAYCQFLAAAGPRDSRLALALTESYGLEQVSDRVAEGISQVMAAGRGRQQALKDALKVVREERDRSLGRLETVLDIVEGQSRRRLQAALGAALQRVRSHTKAQERLLRGVISA